MNLISKLINKPLNVIGFEMDCSKKEINASCFEKPDLPSPKLAYPKRRPIGGGRYETPKND